MEMLKTGQFYGATSQKLELNELVITDTDYVHPFVDWHYHENTYLTFILEGKVFEGNRKENFHCTTGDLLYHNWQESHYNIKPEECFTRGFHIELKPNWFSQYDLPISIIEGSKRLINPELKLIMYRLFVLFKSNHPSRAALDAELLQFYSVATGGPGKLQENHWPRWAIRLKELLEDENTHELSLKEIATAVNVHPVHLSRSFQKYFKQSFSDYQQLKKIENASKLIIENKASLAGIAADCGFADQSHFIRAFKKHQGLTPYAFKKLIALGK